MNPMPILFVFSFDWLRLTVVDPLHGRFVRNRFHFRGLQTKENWANITRSNLKMFFVSLWQMKQIEEKIREKFTLSPHCPLSLRKLSERRNLNDFKAIFALVNKVFLLGIFRHFTICTARWALKKMKFSSPIEKDCSVNHFYCWPIWIFIVCDFFI